MIRKAWEMAREAFPSVENLYVETPQHLGFQGHCPVFDLGKNDPIGQFLYRMVSVDQKPVLVMELDGNSASLSMPKVSQSFQVPTRTEKFSAAKGIEPTLISKNCSDGFELGRKLALLVSDELKDGANSREGVESWLKRNGFPEDMITPTLEGLHGLGHEAVEGSFNLKAANPKHSFDAYQRVRIVQPSSMEHQECGKVLEVRGGGKDPEWYLVLVDGSEKPLWFPSSSLAPDEAGAIRP
jgi:hypothetical protein